MGPDGDTFGRVIESEVRAVMIFRGSLLFLLSALASLTIPAMASQADAVAISRNIQARHLPWGTIVDPVYASPEGRQIVNYSRCGDSAIWTGHYLAAEAYRYKVTGEAEALANIQSALAGIQSLVDVTGTDLLARCRFPSSSPWAQSIILEEQHNGIYSNASTGYSWVGNTSRDQYLGVFFGLSVAWDLVGDASVHASIATLVTRMLSFLVGHAWTVIMPDGSIATTFIPRPEEQLSLLQVGRRVNPGKFSTVWDANAALVSVGVSAPIALDVKDNNSYFKFNLDYIALFNLIRLEDSTVLKFLFQSAYDVLRRHTSSHQNPFFDLIDRVLNGANAGRDQGAVALLNAWLKRPARDIYVDLDGVMPSCGSPSEACNPVEVSVRPTTDFLWQRDPFMLVGGGQGTIEGAGIDYILPFWMARYYGIADASAVVSAASGDIVSVAPESIATFYGAGLTSGTAQASALPLPTSLNGISVQITDLLGVQRFAPLFYISPSQINFEVPPGTSIGRAIFTVLNGATAVAATTGSIQLTAPGIFAAVPSAGYLTLYGTGIRNSASLSTTTATIGGLSASVLYAGPQGTNIGLDQVNLAIPAALRGLSQADAVLTINGQSTNTIRFNLQ
jgi:uncharacterized protein (TIGR03437 family)